MVTEYILFQLLFVLLIFIFSYLLQLFDLGLVCGLISRTDRQTAEHKLILDLIIRSSVRTHTGQPGKLLVGGLSIVKMGYSNASSGHIQYGS